jgi:hypothetical protein
MASRAWGNLRSVVIPGALTIATRHHILAVSGLYNLSDERSQCRSIRSTSPDVVLIPAVPGSLRKAGPLLAPSLNTELSLLDAPSSTSPSRLPLLDSFLSVGTLQRADACASSAPEFFCLTFL